MTWRRRVSTRKTVPQSARYLEKEFSDEEWYGHHFFLILMNRWEFWMRICDNYWISNLQRNFCFYLIVLKDKSFFPFHPLFKNLALRYASAFSYRLNANKVPHEYCIFNHKTFGYVIGFEINSVLIDILKEGSWSSFQFSVLVYR